MAYSHSQGCQLHRRIELRAVRHRPAGGGQLAGRTQHWYIARTAACHAQLGRMEEARERAAEVLGRKPDFHLSAVRLPYKNPADAEHVLDGMGKAGLPD